MTKLNELKEELQKLKELPEYLVETALKKAIVLKEIKKIEQGDNQKE